MKKELYIPLIIIALTLVFGIICLMVYLSNGNAYWIKKKLKIGALLLTFSWFANSCEIEPTRTCYLPAMPENSISISNQSDSIIYSIKDTMFIQIDNPSYPYFSYDILDKSMNSIKSDLLNKHFDSTTYNEFYFLIFTVEFTPGKYQINFYGEKEEIVTRKNKIKSYDFSIE
ncbi:MAG: hypothetical protein V1779_15710 [bacterium]